MLFRDRPSAALKIFVAAAVVSYAAVALTHLDGCTSTQGECLLLSPAVIVYWAPAFAAVWIVMALIVKIAQPGPPVLPSLRIDPLQETPYLRAKGEDGVSLAAAAIVLLLLQYLPRTIALRTDGRLHAAALIADEFARSQVGIAVILVAVGVPTRWILRRARRRAAEELS